MVSLFNRSRYNHILSNSLIAEHNLSSGLNLMPTSVMRIEDCVAHAFDANLSQGERPVLHGKAAKPLTTNKSHREGEFSTTGRSLPSQTNWKTKGKALVTDVPITYLGYVNRDSGVIEAPGHPLDGVAIADTILIYPKGSGSPVAPFVLMGLINTTKGPRSIVNRVV